MAICIVFELVQLTNSGARYKYGECLKDLDYELEFRFIGVDFNQEDILIDDIMILVSEKKSRFMALKVFSQVYKTYIIDGTFIPKGGYYA
ncbi:hypothetical protein [Paenibacillus luteus]|uniref:hypothetical protein n=1 Tax=Paenibacillus luteus TaxID=2545753 RepID=UPI0011425E41|nr:hypothetical protein [Paenibacillus luteus]